MLQMSGVPEMVCMAITSSGGLGLGMVIVAWRKQEGAEALVTAVTAVIEVTGSFFWCWAVYNSIKGGQLESGVVSFALVVLASLFGWCGKGTATLFQWALLVGALAVSAEYFLGILLTVPSTLKAYFALATNLWLWLGGLAWEFGGDLAASEVETPSGDPEVELGIRSVEI